MILSLSWLNLMNMEKRYLHNMFETDQCAIQNLILFSLRAEISMPGIIIFILVEKYKSLDKVIKESNSGGM